MPLSEQYEKYQWIELDLVKNTSDFRPESYRPYSHETEIKIIDEIKADGCSWDARRNYVLKKVYTNLTALIAEAKDKNICTSLAVFKPKEILDVIIEPCEREWSKEKLATLQQLSIFDSVATEKPKHVQMLEKSTWMTMLKQKMFICFLALLNNFILLAIILLW